VQAEGGRDEGLDTCVCIVIDGFIHFDPVLALIQPIQSILYGTKD